MLENRILRTPDHYFDNLPGFPFQPKYVNVAGLRVHYIDEGISSSHESILCLHGEPSWSYLYRKMIPPLAERYRVLAMDFIGFGRSDKLVDPLAYTFELHRQTLAGFLDALYLDQITIIVQDWGGLIGLALVAVQPERFARLVIMNTGLPTGEEPMPEAFLRWRQFAERLSNKMPISRIIQGGLANPKSITQEELAAYEAPFPDRSYKAGVAVWPLLVPLNPDDPGAAAMRQTRKVLANWHKPAIVLFSDSDPITKGGDIFFRKLIPSASMHPRIVISNAGHFLQEEKGEEIAAHIINFVNQTAIGDH